MPHQYAFDAAKTLIQCQDGLTVALSKRECPHLSRMKEGLKETESQLQAYFQKHLSNDSMELGEEFDELIESCPPTTLEACIQLLKETKRRRKLKKNRNTTRPHSPSVNNFYEIPQRTTTDSLLFRLITILQLSLVRIDDVNLVMTRNRRNTLSSGGNHTNPSYTTTTSSPSFLWTTVLSTTTTTAVIGILAIAGHVSTSKRISSGQQSLQLILKTNDWTNMLAKVSFAGAIWTCLKTMGNQAWTTSKIKNSSTSIEEWNRQWRAIQAKSNPPWPTTSSSQTTVDLDDKEQARLLLEYALSEPRKTSLWHTSGELRFFMLKRAMDIFYASVETARRVTNASSASDWQLLGATAAAASFYSTPGTGASQRVAAVTASAQTAADLIRNAWGMVSLPAVKNLSLQASRFLKGAAVADRVVICGVPCFVLSKDPAPELATAIEEFKRLTGVTTAPSLATIEEEEEHIPPTTCSTKPFARSTSLTQFRQRDVIFHLTGGGFFAHIIASDLPYLLDWSSATGAVVICPEYALLPDHCFPHALNEVIGVYETLVSGEAACQLGFEVNRIVVTGESAGGNLASALCVKLSFDAKQQELNEAAAADELFHDGESQYPNSISIRLPDALMLSCPVLDLSSELSPSRLELTRDPVMPGSIISAISDAYVPHRINVSKQDPLASPIYAADNILKRFPPTLLFASSNDPVLDDSVVFNRRLRSLGVDSQLQVADNLPHAYLGLGTTGFPEAVQVQQDCQSWLRYQLTREHTLGQDSSGSW